MIAGDFARIAPNVKLGRDVKIYAFVNLYGCEIGDESKIGAFVEIQKGARIGRRVKVSSHTFICEGVTIEDGVFIGHGVMFINDKYPHATNESGELQTEADWRVHPYAGQARRVHRQQRHHTLRRDDWRRSHRRRRQCRHP